MLTAAARLNDKLGGFALGADAPLKPFAFEELRAARALARRPPRSRRRCWSLPAWLDPFRREVYRDGRYVKLTRKQFAVLELLLLRTAAS